MYIFSVFSKKKTKVTNPCAFFFFFGVSCELIKWRFKLTCRMEIIVYILKQIDASKCIIILGIQNNIYLMIYVNNLYYVSKKSNLY